MTTILSLQLLALIVVLSAFIIIIVLVKQRQEYDYHDTHYHLPRTKKQIKKDEKDGFRD